MHVTITTEILTIEMSEIEAQTLRILCQHAGGDPHHSRRKHMDALDKALHLAGILCYEGPGDQRADGSVYFKDEEV